MAAPLELKISAHLDDEWMDIFNTLPLTNLLQCPNTAIALYPEEGQRALWGKIYNLDTVIGIFQLAEARIFGNVFHASFSSCT